MLTTEYCKYGTKWRVCLCRLAPTQGEAWASADEDLHSRLTPLQTHAGGDALPAHMAHFLASQQAAGPPQTGSMGSAQVGKCCDTCHSSPRLHPDVKLPFMHIRMALMRRDGLIIRAYCLKALCCMQAPGMSEAASAAASMGAEGAPALQLAPPPLQNPMLNSPPGESLSFGKECTTLSLCLPRVDPLQLCSSTLITTETPMKTHMVW